MEKVKNIILLDNNTEQVLEFDKIKRLVSEFCVAQPGKEKALGAQPFAEPGDAEQELAMLDELIRFRNEHRSRVPVQGLPDVRELIEHLQPLNSYLDPSDYWTLAEFCETVESCKKFFNRHRDSLPNCYIKYNALVGLPELVWVIKDKINAKGELLDNASPRLKELRREIHVLHERIHRQLEQIINMYRGGAVLQDFFYSIRNGRYVLPVRAGSKKQVPGIIQGASNTGETLFIEPFDIVEESNDLADLRIQEANEVRKILIAIGDAVRRHIPDLKHNVELMAELDYLTARAEFAIKYGLSIPKFSRSDADRNGTLYLRGVHHPLLYINEREKSVAIDLTLRPEDKVLVITGPNAGGKTTALKTIGLITLMVQSAIPVPCSAESRVPFFNGVFADIGDEQDVQRGLSTFTAHVQNITRILGDATPDSLVLLDELGTATDPQEGSALGIAVLEQLSQTAALTIVTSHLSGLKEWAHRHPSARNAGVKLDEETRLPTYRLYMDVPGTSEALTIARQEGMPESIIARARQIVQQDELNLTELIHSLQKKEQAVAQKIQILDKELGDARAKREEYEQLLKEIERQKKILRKEILEEKEQLLRSAKQKIERMIAELPYRTKPAEARKELTREIKQVESELQQIERELKPVAELLKEIQKGDVVFLPAFNQYGVLTEINAKDSSGEVQVKGMTVHLPLSEIEPVSDEKKNAVLKDLQTQSSGIRINVKRPAEFQIDLHGLTVEEAMPRVEKFLDNAVVHNLPYVKIIHGHGTGRLMREIHKTLEQHPYVKSFRLALPYEGGPATTIVEFKEE